MNPTRIIRLAQSTPLPCNIYNPATNAPCGKPAYAAYASEFEEPNSTAGLWIVQPVCQDCAMAANKVYEDS